VIVDTDKTASNILSIMNKQKMSGEVTFMPLNKLKYSEVDYPTNSVSYHHCNNTAFSTSHIECHFNGGQAKL